MAPAVDENVSSPSGYAEPVARCQSCGAGKLPLVDGPSILVVLIQLVANSRALFLPDPTP